MKKLSEIESTKKPRYLQLAEEIRELIRSDALRPGDPLPSISELRATYGISKSTIERVHMLLEKEKLITREHGRGTFVMRQGSSQKSIRSQSRVIGFCSGGFSQANYSPYVMRLMEGIEKTARDRDIQILLLRDDTPKGWDQVDGVLATGTWPKIPTRYVKPELPIVSLFAPTTLVGGKAECAGIYKSMTTICADDYGGMRAATEHLLSLGHRRIAYLHNNRKGVIDHISSKRVKGYRDALNCAGIRPNSRWLRSLTARPVVYFIGAGRDAMKEWIASDWKQLGCTALLAHNDEVAWGAVEALREAGMSVPKDVSVVGFDGTEAADCCNPKLTTNQVALTEMGAKGVELLQKKNAGEEYPKKIVIPVQLRVGGSTARI